MKNITFFISLLLANVLFAVSASADNFDNTPAHLGVLASIPISASDLQGNGDLIFTVSGADERITGTCMGPGHPMASNQIGDDFDLILRKRILKLDIEFEVDHPYSFASYLIAIYVSKWWDSSTNQYTYFDNNPGQGINEHHNYIQCYYTVELFVNYNNNY